MLQSFALKGEIGILARQSTVEASCKLLQMGEGISASPGAWGDNGPSVSNPEKINFYQHEETEGFTWKFEG